MTTEDLYYDEEAETSEAQPETITIPAEELSAEVKPGVMLEVVSVEDGIVTLRVAEQGPKEPEESEAEMSV